MGGHAFPDSSPLDRERADSILASLRAALGWEIEPAGSYWHKATFPDLDLIVSDLQFDARRVATLGQTMAYGFGGAGLRFVADGLAHQVDFFPVVSMEWGRFSRAGAPDSGALRAVLLKAAASTYEEPGRDYHRFHQGVEVFRAGRTLDLRRGLRRIYQHSIRKDRTGFLKNPITVDRAEFVRLSGVQVPEVATITDPARVQEMLLGGQGLASSAAGIAEHMQRTFSPERMRRIVHRVRERGFVFPAAMAGVR